MFNKCQTASTDLGLCKSREAAIITVPSKPQIVSVIFFFFNSSNKTAYYYQVWFEYLAEKGKVIDVFFN